MTDNDLVRIVNMKATEAEYNEYARLLAEASKASWKVAKCAAMLVAKYEPEAIGWSEDFVRKSEAERMKLAAKSHVLIDRIAETSGQLRHLACTRGFECLGLRRSR